jgi:hypothetical protein
VWAGSDLTDRFMFQLLSFTLPDAYVEVTNKYFLETEIISNAPLIAIFLEMTSDSRKCHDAAF